TFGTGEYYGSVCVSVCMCVYLCVCVCVCVCVQGCAHVYVCVYLSCVCMCVSMCVEGGDSGCCYYLSLFVIWWVTVAPGSERSEEHTSELQSHLNLVCR